ncbi:MAG TPA: hypothetical protein VFH54_06015 [Mycobacteriales bacterium]|nr:hypothetical protein [Mycobacteriales bacterium]
MTAQLEFPTVDEVCALVVGDPVHEREREAVVAAIRSDAAANDGHVDPNRVRELVPAWVGPRVVSATYNALRTRRLLIPAGWTTNTDRRGRNVGKPIRTYTWRGEAA